MVSGCDSKTRHEVVDDSPHESLSLDGSRHHAIDTEERHSAEDNNVEPIQMFVPI
jgi:hypothetical protein